MSRGGFWKREFILNRLNIIYCIYIFVELTIAINLLTKKEFAFLFYDSIGVIAVVFVTMYTSTKNNNGSQKYYNFLNNTMIFMVSLSFLGREIKIFISPVFVALFSYFVYLKYTEEKNKPRIDPPPSFGKWRFNRRSVSGHFWPQSGGPGCSETRLSFYAW